MVDAEKVKADVYARIEEDGELYRRYAVDGDLCRCLIDSVVGAVVACVNEESVRLREQWDVTKTAEYHDFRT